MGPREQRTKGTPQGGVISPLLANLFLHYAFDRWMRRTYPAVPFERYADDAIVHCRTEAQAQEVLGAIRERFEQCGLELHPRRRGSSTARMTTGPGQYEHVAFDFLGYTFQPRRARNRQGKNFSSFLPAMSNKAAKTCGRPSASGGWHPPGITTPWRIAETRGPGRSGAG